MINSDFIAGIIFTIIILLTWNLAGLIYEYNWKELNNKKEVKKVFNKIKNDRT